MNIVIIDHPKFSGTRSIFRYTEMIAAGLREKKHSVDVWRCEAYFSRLFSSKVLSKYLQYLDRFLVFPYLIQRKLNKCAPNTLFVFSDQALGPWVPLVKDRPHVIHCHDFMAQRSALGEVPQNRIGFPGRWYQAYIRKGYRQGRNFISISKKTRQDLHRFLISSPAVSAVIYNGFNLDFKPGKPQMFLKSLQQDTGLDLTKGYILHIGGDLFYKNREGVVEIYDAWRDKNQKDLPLVFVGALPGKKLRTIIKKSKYSGNIHFLENVSDEVLKFVYQGASVLLFPSIDEGFGWPIAEALASGCPVITTNKAPMNEVGGPDCLYLPCKTEFEEENKWVEECAVILTNFFSLSKEELEILVEQGLVHAQNFSTQRALDKIEDIYKKVLLQSQSLIPNQDVQQAV